MLATVQIKPRPVFCVIEHAHRDRALAEAVRAGWFSHAGITLKLGTRPDWLTASFPRDEEWRIEWSKFYYGLDLAAAFRETGDLSFLNAWESLVESWIEQMPVDFDSSDVTARRIQNWIYAWNIFQSEERFPGLSSDLDERIAANIREQVIYLRQNLSSERNHRTLELYALFIAALALPEIDQNEQMLSFSIDELCRNLLADVRADGVHREHSTHYHMIALRSFIGARRNGEQYGLSFPKEYDERLERACEFAMHCHRPDGAIPALSDSDSGSYVDVLELAATIFARADFQWVATKGSEGTPPQKKYADFDESGYFFQRSGWGEVNEFKNERFLVFDSGPLGDGGHGHYDALSIEIAAGGRPLVVDPGRYTYHEGTPNFRQWFKGTAAHNTVCVDGLDQTPYRRGKPKGVVAVTRLIDRISAPNFDLICGRVESASYEAVHTRFVFFIADEYWVVVDQLRGERPHNYDLRFHLTPEAMNHVSVESDSSNHAVIAPGLSLVFPANNQPYVQPGWCAPKYGEKLPAPVVSVRVDDVANTDFFTLIAPRTKSNDPPLTLKTSESGNRISFSVSGVGPEQSQTDYVVWSAVAEPFKVGRHWGSAHTTWRRASAWETRSLFAACRFYRLDGLERDADARSLRWLLCDEQDRLTFDDGRPL